MDLVTLDEAKDNLLIDFTDTQTDRDLAVKISAASSAVISYLRTRKAVYEPLQDDDGVTLTDSNGDALYVTDSNGDRIVRTAVKQATLLLVGYFFRDRDGTVGKEWAHGYLPPPVISLLYPYRDPAIA